MTFSFCIRTASLLACLAAHAEKSIQSRIADRSFPSVFQAWNPVENIAGEDPLQSLVRHDLYFHGVESFRLEWDQKPVGLATGFIPESIERARTYRQSLLEKNANLILLAEIRYRGGPKSFLPANHPWWKRNADGKTILGWEEGGYMLLDYSNPEFRRHVAHRCGQVFDSGVVDGIMLDWWRDDDDRIELIRAIRREIGEDALILGNSNDRKIPRNAPYVNGLFMECTQSKTAEDWAHIAETLTWAESSLREPRINCLETWYHQSRGDLPLMRLTTTLALTRSDGYCLFADPNPLPSSDHLHDWYAFWDAPLGRPLGRGKEQKDGSYHREFSGGTAVYNPMGNPPVQLSFDEPRRSQAFQNIGNSHTVPGGEGDLLLKEL